MAPTISPALLDFVLEKRQYGYGYGYNRNHNSAWNRWGRWVALVVIVGFFLVLAFACSCINSRRRRRRGLAPRYGTGWLAGKNTGNQQHYQNNDYYQGQQSGYNYGGGAGGVGTAPAPPYSPPQQQYGGGNTDYYGGQQYGGQQSGIELQQPPNSYNPQTGREQIYEPPSGPPPGKQGDGIIR